MVSFEHKIKGGFAMKTIIRYMLRPVAHCSEGCRNWSSWFFWSGPIFIWVWQDLKMS